MDQQVERQAREKVDQAMDTMSSALNDVAQMASAMQQGDFSIRLANNKPGLLGQVSQNLNQSMVQVQTAFDAISVAAKALAQGDLTQHIDNPMDGELDELKQSINEAVAELNQLISTLAHTSQAIEQDADRVQTNSSIVAQSAQNQVQSLAQTANAVQQMRASVEQNNQATHQVNNLAREADEISKHGVESMQKLDQSMNKVNESSKQIANIVSLIDSIAFQTNLLALNAAVEAARAGEAGRGFAVVASEVRGLAQKSAEASKDIRHLIDQTVSRVADSIGLVEHASETFNQIQHKITDVAQLMGGVASSSQQQYQGALQIHQLVENMDQDTRQMTDKVEDSAQSAEVMAEQSTQLNQMVRRFKVKHQGNKQLTLTHKT
jgi:methyl-accepting chemotaxis protein